MKKLFTLLMVVAFSTTAAFSQGGTFAVGVGSEMSNADEEKSWQNYSLVPTLGYFINDNMLVVNYLKNTDYLNIRYQKKPFMLLIWLSALMLGLGGMLGLRDKLK